jgi:hypothetical protein
MTKATCWVPDGDAPCGKPVNGDGLCRTHYSRRRLRGDVQAHRPAEKKQRKQADGCTVGDCGKKPQARNMCSMHYNRWRKAGAPGPAHRLNELTNPAAPTKRCRKCGQTKTKADFHRDPRSGDEKAGICKACAGIITRASQLRRKYGLSPEQLDRLFHQQRGRCAICQEKPDERGLVVDHCHESGDVRALLCNACNTLLGMARDDIGRLRAAIRYLENAKNAQST